MFGDGCLCGRGSFDDQILQNRETLKTGQNSVCDCDLEVAGAKNLNVIVVCLGGFVGSFTDWSHVQFVRFF